MSSLSTLRYREYCLAQVRCAPVLPAPRVASLYGAIRAPSSGRKRRPCRTQPPLRRGVAACVCVPRATRPCRVLRARTAACMLHCPLPQVLRAPALATDARFASPADRVRHRGELGALIDAEFSRCPRVRFSVPLLRLSVPSFRFSAPLFRLSLRSRGERREAALMSAFGCAAAIPERISWR